jgi:AcrR family transcriptional regulator
MVMQRGRKFAQVLEGARDVFLRDGFHGASVDDIAGAAGVSKATLYAYVPDKRQLFAEVLRAECSALSARAAELIEGAGGVEEGLLLAARCLVDFHVSPLPLAVFRLCVAETERFPEIGRAYFESAPGDILQGLAGYLGRATAAGQIAVSDADSAAAQFMALTRAGYFEAVLFGVAQPPDEAARDRIARDAVALFLARYGVQPLSRSTEPAR